VDLGAVPDAPDQLLAVATTDSEENVNLEHRFGELSS